MTLVTDILARAARQCSITPPSSWLTATSQTTLEVLDFLDMTITDIRDRLDLTGPMGKTMAITGTGVEDYALPADFHRLQRDSLAVYEQSRTRRACVPIPADGQWEYLQELGTSGAYRFYRLQGYPGAYTIGFQRPLETDLTVIVSYVSTEWLINAATRKSEFTAAEDECLLPRELIETGIVWRFRHRKALEYRDVQGRYETLMARLDNDGRTRRSVDFGPTPTRAPWDVPVPDVIPNA